MSEPKHNQTKSKFEIIVSLISTIATVVGAIAAILGLCVVTKISVEVKTVADNQSEIITHYETKTDTIYIIQRDTIVQKIYQQNSVADEWLKQKDKEIKEWTQQQNEKLDTFTKSKENEINKWVEQRKKEIEEYSKND
jgi:hypothetical protein